MTNDPRIDRDDPWDDAAGEPLFDRGAFSNREAAALIEEAIRAAGRYIVPSDDLRPRTLEAAREVSEERRGGMKLGRFAAVLLFCVVVSAPTAERVVAWYERASAPSAAELEARALEIATDRNVGPHWGLLEAFTQLRRMQASRLGQIDAPTAMQ